MNKDKELTIPTLNAQEEDDDDDALLLEAMNQSMAQYEQEEKAQSSAIEAAAAAMSVTSGFNPAAGDSWIYPTNYPVRQYQVLPSGSAAQWWPGPLQFYESK